MSEHKAASYPIFYQDSDRTPFNDNGYYCDPGTGERLKVTFRVRVAMRAIHEEEVEVAAYSVQEALQLAINDRDWIWKKDWDFNKVDIAGYQGSESNSEFVTVDEVACEEPPAGSIPSVYTMMTKFSVEWDGEDKCDDECDDNCHEHQFYCGRQLPSIVEVPVGTEYVEEWIENEYDAPVVEATPVTHDPTKTLTSDCLYCKGTGKYIHECCDIDGPFRYHESFCDDCLCLCDDCLPAKVGEPHVTGVTCREPGFDSLTQLEIERYGMSATYAAVRTETSQDASRTGDWIEGNQSR